MGLDIRLQQRLDLSLKLAPQIIQSIELLQLPALDLLEMIEQELDTNEFLEKVPSELTAEPAKEAAGEDGEKTDDEVERYDQMDIWDDPSLRRPRSRDDDRMHAKMEAMQNTASDGPSLQARLLEQFHLLENAEKDLPLAEQIIFNIDDRGYLSYTLSEVLEPVADQYGQDDAERVLRRIQSLEPKGVGARSTKECLLLQLDPKDDQFDLKVELVENHLDDVEKNRLPKVAKDLGLDMDALKDLLTGLSELTLRPGLGDRQDRNHYIMPDVIVEWNGSDYDIRLANEFVPELRLSPEYRLVLSDAGASKDYREYVKRKVDSARAFIMAVEKRQKTLLDVSKRIIHHQRDFLDFGPHYLRPLKMQEVADDLHVHVSTISRATSDKHMQTHRGIFSLKDFFTGGTRSTSGELESRESIKQKIQEIVDREDKDSPLSDDDLVVKLQELHGVLVARRTVTKYRKALGVPSSRQRKEFR
jgi:RNA polymerase sigma-54 factor